MTPDPNQNLSAEAATQAPLEAQTPSESEIYDRQIRLWGAEAQSKMSSAKVLYIKTSGISSEILKNLVLAGVQASIVDGRFYPDAMTHTPSSFLPPSERLQQNAKPENGDLGEPNTKKVKKMTVARAMAPSIQELNPLLPPCEINEEENIESIPSAFLNQFDIIIASKISIKEAFYITNCTKENDDNSNSSDSNNVKFYLVHSFGFNACALIDLGRGHQFRKEIGKELSGIQSIQDYLTFEEMCKVPLHQVKDRWHKNGPPEIYVQLRCIMNYYGLKQQWPSESNISDFVSATKEFLMQQGLKEDYLGNDSDLGQLGMTANAEVSPVCAVIGGVLGNELIKAISGRGEPANNMILFDGLESGCKTFTLKKP